MRYGTPFSKFSLFRNTAQINRERRNKIFQRLPVLPDYQRERIQACAANWFAEKSRKIFVDPVKLPRLGQYRDRILPHFDESQSRKTFKLRGFSSFRMFIGFRGIVFQGMNELKNILSAEKFLKFFFK